MLDPRCSRCGRPDVLDQVQGRGKAALHSLEALLSLGRVASQGQDVVDARVLELQTRMTYEMLMDCSILGLGSQGSQ